MKSGAPGLHGCASATDILFADQLTVAHPLHEVKGDPFVGDDRVRCRVRIVSDNGRDLAESLEALLVSWRRCNPRRCFDPAAMHRLEAEGLRGRVLVGVSLCRVGWSVPARSEAGSGRVELG